jgi:hypothetical protein
MKNDGFIFHHLHTCSFLLIYKMESAVYRLPPTLGAAFCCFWAGFAFCFDGATLAFFSAVFAFFCSLAALKKLVKHPAISISRKRLSYD